MRKHRAALLKHVGTDPTVIQRMLVDRVAWLQHFIDRLDQKSIEAGSLSEREVREYLQSTAALVRALRELGVRPATSLSPDPPDDLPPRPKPHRMPTKQVEQAAA